MLARSYLSNHYKKKKKEKKKKEKKKREIDCRLELQI
jgi:hypothetical protein